jgi:alpha-ketoglutarate-dependent taurine dioxygenase
MQAATETAAAVRFEQLMPHIGSLVHVDRARMSDPDVVAAIRTELDSRGVLVFPRAHLSDTEQLAFTDAFGQRLDYTRRPGTDDGEKGDDIYKIQLGKGARFGAEFVYATWFWHMDGAVVDQPLPKATMLSARTLSPKGGQTEFASTFAAWAQLPAGMQREVEGLEVVHRLAAVMRHVFPAGTGRASPLQSQSPPMVMPLVWTQADGRKSLVIGTHADEVLGMSYADGRALLERLLQWAVQPDFTYSHEWQAGDFVVWNNHGVMHRVVPYPDDCGRTMNRTSVAGDMKLGRVLAA